MHMYTYSKNKRFLQCPDISFPNCPNQSFQKEQIWALFQLPAQSCFVSSYCRIKFHITEVVYVYKPDLPHQGL